MKHVFFIYYTCTLKYSDKSLIGAYRCFSWFVFVLGSSTCSTVINEYYKVIIFYNLASTMVEYMCVCHYSFPCRKQLRSLRQLIDELQKFQMCLNVFLVYRIFSMKIPTSPCRGPVGSRTTFSSILAWHLSKTLEYLSPFSVGQSEKLNSNLNILLLILV